MGNGASASVSRREILLLALVFVALTLLFTYPLPLNLAGSTFQVGPDGNLFAWTLAWDVHAFLRQPLAIFDANILYPQRDTLAYSENLIGSAFFAAPVLWLTKNPVLALNVVELLTVVLCGVGAYVLARRLGIGRPAAVLAGIVFAFTPPRFFRTGQLHLGAVQWIPFGLAFLHSYLDSGRRRDIRLAAAFFSLQALSSGHGGSFMTLAFVGLLAYRLALGEPPAVVRRIRDLGVSGVLLLAPAALVYLPYRRVQRSVSLRRSLENWGVTPESFLASPSHLHQWLWSLVSDIRIQDDASAFLFPGYLTLVLAGVAFFWRSRANWRFDNVTFYALLTVLCYWLSAGPPIGLWPLVYDWPGLSFIRVPSRFSILAMLGLAMLVGFGFDRLSGRVSPPKRCAVAAVLGVLMLGEFAAFPMAVVPARADIPAVDRWLASRPTPFVVAEVPVGGERRESEFMLHTRAHWQKTVHGYSGFRPPQYDELYAQLRRFPDDTSLGALARFGVTYVVVHTDLYEPGDWEPVRERIGRYGARLRLVHVADAGRVYELVGPS